MPAMPEQYSQVTVHETSGGDYAGTDVEIRIPGLPADVDPRLVAELVAEVRRQQEIEAEEKLVKELLNEHVVTPYAARLIREREGLPLKPGRPRSEYSAPAEATDVVAPAADLPAAKPASTPVSAAAGEPEVTAAKLFGGRISRKAATVTALFAIAGAGGAAVTIADPLHIGSGAGCATADREKLSMSKWDKLAEQISNDRGYTVDPQELERLNTGVAKTKEGTPQCFIVPAPLAAGQVLGDGQQTPKQMAYEMGVDVDDILKYNKDVVTDPDKPVPDGTRIWLQEKPDAAGADPLIMQPLKGTLKDYTGGDGKKVADILNANLQVFTGDGDMGFYKGHEYYLPYDDHAQTDYMKQKKLTPQEVIQTFTAKGSYDYQKRGATPEASPSQAAPGSETILPSGLTARQEQMIAAVQAKYNLPTAKLDWFKRAIATINQLEATIEKDKINPTVMLGQAIYESGWGQSDKATQGHNYFGMKAQQGDGWTGPTMSADGSNWRVYTDMKAGFQGYIDNLMSKNWYDDARQDPNDDQRTINGLLDQLDADGNIVVPQDKNNLAYCPEPTYGPAVMNVIGNYSLHGLFNFNYSGKPAAAPSAAPSATPKPSPTPEQPAPSPQPHSSEIIGNGGKDTFKHQVIDPKTVIGNVNIDRGWYQKNTKHQASLNVNKSDGAYVTIDGQKVLLRDLTDAVRIRLIDAALNGVRLSTDGYNQFVANYKDIAAQVKADPSLTNFDGNKNGLGKVTNVKSQIKYFVWHYTSTNNSANNADGITAAHQMQNGHRGVGSWGYINQSGQMYQLVDNDHVVNVLGYNNVAWGVEMAGGAQESLTTAQYTSMVYTTVKFLIDNGYVTKGQPVTPAVNSTVRGHGEFADFSSGDHDDNTSMIMDYGRAMVINLLMQLGYAQ